MLTYSQQNRFWISLTNINRMVLSNEGNTIMLAFELYYMNVQYTNLWIIVDHYNKMPF